MKKLLFALFFLCMHYCVCAQQDNSQTDVVALMKKYLLKGYNFDIRVVDLFAKEVETDKSKLNDFIQKNEVGFFSFEEDWLEHNSPDMLLKSGDDYEVLPTFEIYDEKSDRFGFITILSNLIDYFERHPEIDDRLHPYYVDAIWREYFTPTYCVETVLEDWHAWHWGIGNNDIPEKNKYGIDTIDIDEKYSKTILEYYDYKNRTKKMTR